MTHGVKEIRGIPRPVAANETHVDPRADVHPGAHLGAGCTVGSFAVIGDGVSLGPGCVVHSHGVIDGPTEMGAKNEIFPFACIGGAPQDRRHRGEVTRLEVGDSNVFREHVTVSRGTIHGGGVTRLGDSNLLMAYCHVAHDCILGSNIVMANHGTLAGHVTVEDHVVFGGMVAVGTFLRVGESAMLAAGAMIEREVPPFCIVAGDRARMRGVNRVGLERRGFSREARDQIKMIFKALRSPGTPVEQVVRNFRDRCENLTEEATRMLDFLERVERGLAR